MGANFVNAKTARFFNIAPHPWARTGPGQALDGGPKFDLDEFDEAYFKRLRSRVAAADQRGIFQSESEKTFSVELKAGTYRFEWFNADKHAWAGGGRIDSSGGSREFKPPFSGWAVLYLSAAKKPAR